MELEMLPTDAAWAKQREEAKVKMTQVPRYSREYSELRRASMDSEEFKKFGGACRTLRQLADDFGYTERSLYTILKECHVPTQQICQMNQGKGKPANLYYPDDVKPFITDLITRGWSKLLANEKATKRVLRENNYFLKIIRKIIQEIDSDRAQM